MNKDNSIKEWKTNKLPSLHKQNSKTLSNQKCSNYGNLFNQKYLRPFKQHPKNIEQTKALNFINRSNILNTSSIISTLSDCIKTQTGKIFQQSKQFSEENILNNLYLKQDKLPKYNNIKRQSQPYNLTCNSSFYLPNKKNSFQRVQLLNLGKWIDEKLQEFNKMKSININEIIDYKEHILNYGLGKVIDNVRKKSREEGDLLKILIQNSFKIFQKVLEMVSQSSNKQEKEHIEEQKQSRQIYETSLSFLKNQNFTISQQLNGIYQKMKKVIIWNKRLRKEKKSLTILNRILNYRNQTYSQALQQTIDMFLKSVPQPSTLNFSKKIISKLARQKRKVKKHFQTKLIQQDFKIQAKQLVLSWLRRNGFSEVQQEQIDPFLHLTNDEKLQLTKIDDQNNINQVDIYDYFKLLDIGVQVCEPTCTTGTQIDPQMKPKTVAKGIITDTMFKKSFEVQTNMNQGVWFKEEAIRNGNGSQKIGKIIRGSQKKKSNISRFSQKSEKWKEKNQNKKSVKEKNENTENMGQQRELKFSKKGLRNNGKDSTKQLEKRQEDKYLQNSYLHQDTYQTLEEEKNHRFYQKDFTIISQKKSQDFIFDSDEDIKNQNNQSFRISISKFNGIQSKFNKFDLSKHQKDYSRKGRQISFKDFTQIGCMDETVRQSFKQNNLKKLWKAIQQKKIIQTQKRDSRLSMNFINYDNNSYSMKKLEKKLFNQVYEERKIKSSIKQKERQNLYETVVRRRSFYKKGKLIFQNTKDFEENKQTKQSIYKSYLHYRPHKNRTIIQLDEEQAQRLDQINKKMAIPSNLAKSKTLAASKQTFKLLSQSCKKNKKQPPKNKQYFNSSLVSISKNVGALVYDYIKQIKREKDQIQTDTQKIYYPLHTILMEKMNYKYGLKDISEKKMKDFIEKILTFAPVSQKISLYSLLFGMETQGVGADELLIYLKCLVYLEKKSIISSSIHLSKQTNLIDKATTDKEIVQQNIDKILKDFFDKEGIQISKNEVFNYIQKNPMHISLEKISQILILSLLKRKQIFKKDCAQLYKILSKGNNIFSNIYKILKLFNDYKQCQVQYNEYGQMNRNAKQKKKRVAKQVGNQINISYVLKQLIKRSDTIDQIYGKSISFDRFLTGYMVTNMPPCNQLKQIFKFMIELFQQKKVQLEKNKKCERQSDEKEMIENDIKCDAQLDKKQMIKYSASNVRLLQRMGMSWEIKTWQKVDEQNWEWSVSRTLSEHVQNNLKEVIGKIDVISNQIQNFFFSLEKKLQLTD